MKRKTRGTVNLVRAIRRSDGRSRRSRKPHDLTCVDAMNLALAAELDNGRIQLWLSARFTVALVYHHSGTPAQLLRGMSLLIQARREGSQAAAYAFAQLADRRSILIGMPQLFGTQFRRQRDGERESWIRLPMCDCITPAARYMFGVDESGNPLDAGSRQKRIGHSLRYTPAQHLLKPQVSALRVDFKKYVAAVWAHYKIHRPIPEIQTRHQRGK